jgi:uncharacterized membrane protein YphA (DoxX/SURF4 family)
MGTAERMLVVRKRYARRDPAMVALIVLIILTVVGGTAVLLGLTPDTRRPGREWYPAGPDLKN